MKKTILVIGLILSVLFLFGCTEIPDDTNKGSDSSINLEYEWLNGLAQQMLDMNINPKDGYDAIYKCEYKGEIVFETGYHHCCDFGTTIYNINGEQICHFGGMSPPNVDNNCPDYEETKQNCQEIWTSKS
jgi:hypothetical protein